MKTCINGWLLRFKMNSYLFVEKLIQVKYALAIKTIKKEESCLSFCAKLLPLSIAHNSRNSPGKSHAIFLITGQFHRYKTLISMLLSIAFASRTP